MQDTTFTVKCDNEIVAECVPSYYVGMIVEALANKYYNSAAEGDLCITLKAEPLYEKSKNSDDLIPF